MLTIPPLMWEVMIHSPIKRMKQILQPDIHIEVMVFNATFNNILVILWRIQKQQRQTIYYTIWYSNNTRGENMGLICYGG